MSTMLDRLRRLQSLRPQTQSQATTRSSLPAIAPTQGVAPIASAWERGEPLSLQEATPGEEIDTPFGSCYVVTQRYPALSQRGAGLLGDLLEHCPSALRSLHPDFSLDEALHFSQAAFLDTETSGLGGGASVYAFMIGIGVFERLTGEPSSEMHFVVRQFFMRHPGEESALLAAVADALAQRRFTVTFNGRGFDLPLLRTRYFYNRGLLVDADLPLLLEKESAHIDLLLPARRLWKRRLQSCRLIHLEAKLLGVQRSQEDVPGHLIPQIYSDYLSNNDARGLRNVFYHNQEDIVSMVGVAAQIYQAHRALAKGSEGSEPDRPTEERLSGLEWLSLGQHYEANRLFPKAEWAYRKALELLDDEAALNDGFARLGALLKRQERWQEAAACWERWLSSVHQVDATPYIELAKIYEWRLGDLEQAAMWAQWGLHAAQAAPLHTPGLMPPNTAHLAQIDDLRHRLERIQRKQR